MLAAMSKSSLRADSSAKAPARRLPAVLGLASATAIVVGAVIGSGIFLKPREVAEKTGGFTGVIFALWIACGLINLCGALTLAELAAMFPHAGGTYVYLREAYGRLWSFLWAWSEFWVTRTGAIAALAAYAALTVQQLGFVPAEGLGISAGLMRTLIAIAFIVVLALINIAGALWGSLFQNVTTLIKTLFALFLAALPFLALRGHTVSLEPVWPHELHTSLLAGIGSALAAIMWAYDGWGNVTVVSEEIENPARNVPRALILGVLLLIVLYVGANVAYHVTLSAETIAKSPNPAAAVCAVLLPGFGEPLLLSMLLVSLLGALNSNILVGPRVLFAVGRDFPALEPLARISETGKTPARAIGAMAVWASALIALADLSPDAGTPLYDMLTTYCVFGGSIFYLFAVLAVFVLRAREPNRERPYRTWGYPIVPALFVAFYVLLLGTILYGRPYESGFGLTLILLGAVVYGLIVKIQARER